MIRWLMNMRKKCPVNMRKKCRACQGRKRFADIACPLCTPGARMSWVKDVSDK